MTEPGAVLGPGRMSTTARVIHAAVMGGLIIAFLVFLYLQGTITGTSFAGAEQTLKLAGFALVLIAVIVPYMLRGRIPPPSGGTDVDEWWAANLPKAVVLWTIAEGCGLGAMVVGWLVTNTTLLALGAAAALAVLFVNRPSRLASGL